MLNNIFLGGRFAIAIVNVFGSFLGDIHQGGANMGTLAVDSNESIAISPNRIGSSSSPGVANAAGPTLSLGSPQSHSSGDPNDTALILASNVGGGNSKNLPISRFSTDRGLFDDFKLSYLIFPVVFGTFVAITRRVLFKEVKR